MRLATLHTPAGLRAAVRHDDHYIDLHATDAAFPPSVRQLLAAGPEVLDHVRRAGRTVGNDVSARDWQLRKDGKQWMVGKTFDTFAPTGPELVTAEEVGDPHELGIRLRLNGRTMQDSTTRQMIFSVAATLAYLS